MATVTSADFDGVTCPPEVAAQVVNAVLGGAPFARSLTSRPTASHALAFALAGPTGADWVAEGQPLPNVNVNGDSYVVIPAKLAGLWGVTNEALLDSKLNLGAQLGQVVADSAGPTLDDGVLHGTAAPDPIGVLGVAPVTDGVSLWAAALEAQGEIGDAGGSADSIALKPSALATEAATLDLQDRPLYPSGISTFAGLTPVPVPSLAVGEALVYDSKRVLLVVRSDFAVEMSSDAGFSSDVTMFRVRGRFGVAVPVAGKSVRKLTVTPGP
jgi:HK97 family phage major capsid protein